MQRRAYARSRRLITRRSQVQILPPPLRKGPTNAGLVLSTDGGFSILYPWGAKSQTRPENLPFCSAIESVHPTRCQNPRSHLQISCSVCDPSFGTPQAVSLSRLAPLAAFDVHAASTSVHRGRCPALSSSRRRIACSRPSRARWPWWRSIMVRLARTADVDDARLAIDVAPFEREPFGQAKPGGGEQVKPRLLVTSGRRLVSTQVST